MTIICAMHDSQAECTWIGSDSLVTDGRTMAPHMPVKWAVGNGWAVGIAGDLRTVNVFKHYADKLFKDLKSPFEFTLRVRKIFDDEGYETADGSGAKNYAQDLILANSKGVWAICSMLSVVDIPSMELWADGSGQRFALGAAGALGSTSPENCVRKAIEMAIRYDAGCGGEPWILKL